MTTVAAPARPPAGGIVLAWVIPGFCSSLQRYNTTSCRHRNMKLQNVHCSCTVGNLWDSTGQKVWKNTSKWWDIDIVSFDSMIKDAWKSTFRSASRMHKMAIKSFKHFNVRPCHYVTTHSALSVSCFTQLFAAIVVFLETYKKLYVIRIIRPQSGLENSGHLILHLKKTSLHIEWCSSCYVLLKLGANFFTLTLDSLLLYQILE